MMRDLKEHLVIGLGEALWDMLPSGKQMGGAPANFVYHVSQFGIEGVAVGWGYRNMNEVVGLSVANSAQELLKMLIP